ncbi:hypothetical protein [Engelhardtia mirabilis]|uniref:Uncharacterized protein n=1 Tax=Engelhardtia mirabilis TaxID=2528011 RepID=A0A518BF99_9BACT|nr:hypothetical protein Pla133_07250 [Planctomycetes bacterium Pla133]QDU99985.1 hypothetical protein Pla86_07240 [Planctomycetes bacterium Pla86]
MPSPRVTGISKRRRLAVSILALLSIPFVAEAGLRWMLFGSDPIANRLGPGIRHADLYADFSHDEAWWLLHARFEPLMVEQFDTYTRPDPLLGWRNAVLIGDTFEHQAESLLGARRAVLFYGASFVNAEYTLRLLDSPLGASHGLLTYGMGGFGLGQSWLLERETLPRFAGGDPMVLFGVVTDADLPRANMGVREGPKPRFALQTDGTVAIEPCTPGTMRETVGREPVEITSYLWAWLSGLESPLPSLRQSAERRRAERHEQVLAVNLALLGRARDTARDAGADFAVVLFHGPDALRYPPDSTERAVLEYLETAGIDVIDSRPAFEALVAAGDDLGDYFHPPDHPEANHPNEAGREVIAQLLVRAIAKREGAGSPVGPTDPAETSR